MAQRYVRVQNQEERIYYGILQPGKGVQVLDAPPWLQGQPTDLQLEPDTYQLLAPCAPSKIVAVGKNYADHAAEMGTPVPQEPLLFFKPPTSVIATATEIHYPLQSRRVDYEGELALVIGDRSFECTPEQAHTKIWGYTIANDVTASDFRADGQWTRAKSIDTFCPMGPWIETSITDPQALRITTTVNGTVVQDCGTDDMVFGVAEMLAWITKFITLQPGDVVLTASPAGVGPMQVGDDVTIKIDAIGELSNPVKERA